MAALPSRTRQLVALRLHLVAGETWRAAAVRVGLSHSWAYELATRIWPTLRGRRPGIDAARRQVIQDAILNAESGESYRQLAKRHRVSPDTISRWARAMVDAECGDLPRVRTTPVYRCSGCGQRVTVSPCVFCLATSYRQA